MHGVLGGVVNAGVRFGSCDSVKSTSENHRLLLERAKAADACECGAVGPKVTFSALAVKGRNNNSNTWVSGYRTQSAES